MFPASSMSVRPSCPSVGLTSCWSAWSAPPSTRPRWSSSGRRSVRSRRSLLRMPQRRAGKSGAVSRHPRGNSAGRRIGSAAVPGHPEQSLLVRVPSWHPRPTSRRCPPKKVRSAGIPDCRRRGMDPVWVHRIPGMIKPVAVRPADRHWAFQKPGCSACPRRRIRQTIRSATTRSTTSFHPAFAPTASSRCPKPPRRTLLRRVTFDSTGFRRHPKRRRSSCPIRPRRPTPRPWLIES